MHASFCLCLFICTQEVLEQCLNKKHEYGLGGLKATCISLMRREPFFSTTAALNFISNSCEGLWLRIYKDIQYPAHRTQHRDYQFIYLPFPPSDVCHIPPPASRCQRLGERAAAAALLLLLLRRVCTALTGVAPSYEPGHCG